MLHISIHAPTRGATGFIRIRFPGLKYFNPRSHERSDIFDAENASWSEISIHAPTRGATSQVSLLCFKCVISIHAPTRGATVCPCTRFWYATISIHAPTRGATLGMSEQELFDTAISIHAPTRGATIITIIIINIHVFQSTLPREERQQYCTKNLFIFIQYRQ